MKPPNGEAEGAPNPGSAAFFSRHWRATLASVLLALGLGWLLRAGGLPLLPPKDALARVDWLLVAGFVALMIVHMVTRFARYHFLIAPIAKLSFRKLMTINAIALALITFLPLRLGEVARPAMLRKKGHVSAWAVAGTVGAERVLDGVVFCALLFLGLAVAKPRDPLPTHIGELPIPASLVTQAAQLASLIFGVAFLLMAAFYWAREPARRLTERVLGIVSARLAARVADIVQRLSDGLQFLTNPRYTLPYLGVTLFSIASQIASIELLAQAVGLPEVTFPQCVVVLGLLALGFGMPNAPGFFGTVQLALYAGLACYVAPEKVAHEGSVLVFLFYATYLLMVVVQAAVALVVEYGSPAEAPARDASATETT